MRILGFVPFNSGALTSDVDAHNKSDASHASVSRMNRKSELLAQTDLNKAIAEMQRATGNSLTANNVTVSPR
jgi:hypothetical protein